MIVALVTQKGGAGKSTLSIHLASELVARGYRVLLVDADPQRTAVTWGDVAGEAGHPAPTIVAMSTTLHQPEQLPRLAAAYDHVLIDTPPRSDEIQRSAMAVADLVLLPCEPTPPDVWALAESLQVVKRAMRHRDELEAKIVINKRRARTAAARGVREALAETGLPVLSTEIGLRQSFADALGAGQGVGGYAPRDMAAQELAALVDEVFGSKTSKKRKRA